MRRDQDSLTNSNWTGMTSSIQPLPSRSYSKPRPAPLDHPQGPRDPPQAPRDHPQATEYQPPVRTNGVKDDQYAQRGVRTYGSASSGARMHVQEGQRGGYVEEGQRGDYQVPQRSYSDSTRSRENGMGYDPMERRGSQASYHSDSLPHRHQPPQDQLHRSATLGRFDTARRPVYPTDRASHNERIGSHDDVRRAHDRVQYDRSREAERMRETAFPARADVYTAKADVYSSKVRSRESPKVDMYDRPNSREDPRRFSTLQPRDVKEFRRFEEYEDRRQTGRRENSRMNGNKVPEDIYKAVQHRTPNDHIFVQYGKEVRRVVTPQLPVPLDKLLDKAVAAYSETLTPDMVPLKAVYIQDAQTKIFYQLDDENDVAKGSHLKIHEEFVQKNMDRGSSQSLEDLNNSSNSSLSSGGFVIPVSVPPPKPPPNMRRPLKSRLSLVEERLSLITHEMINKQANDTLSTVSSQTDFNGGTTSSRAPAAELHDTIRTLQKNLSETRAELLNLRRREQSHQADMVRVMRETAVSITRHIEAAMPTGIRKQRIEADGVETCYRETSETTYTNIKDLERTVEMMKSDVVKRKVKLNPVQLDAMEKELDGYTTQISKMNSTFGTLKESLKTIMNEELEIIVNEEQFLADEEPALEEATIKCEDLTKVVQTLKKVAAMQKAKGSNPLSIYTTNECDILEERNQVIEAIAQLVPNHEERIQSIQATEEFRVSQRKFLKSESDQVTEQIQLQSQNLRKTNAFEELEAKREEALRAMYAAQPPPHKFGKKNTSPGNLFSYQGGESVRRASISKCKSMSSIVHENEERGYTFADSDNEYSSADNNIKRSRSFTGDKDKTSSEEDKSKKKTMFSGFFSKKSKSKQEPEPKGKEQTEHNSNSSKSNGDVFVVDTKQGNPPSPGIRIRSYTETKRSGNKHKTRPDRSVSVNFESDKAPKYKKGKGRLS